MSEVTLDVASATSPVTDVSPEIEVEVAPPVAKSDRIPCRICGTLYLPGPGMARHLRTAHNEQYLEDNTLPRVFCPECKLPYAPGSLGKHLRNMHGIYRGARRGRPPKRHPVPAIKPTPLPAPPKRKPLLAEEIVRAAALALWPSGIPHDTLDALLTWHRQTQEFLAVVQEE